MSVWTAWTYCIWFRQLSHCSACRPFVHWVSHCIHAKVYLSDHKNDKIYSLNNGMDCTQHWINIWFHESLIDWEAENNFRIGFWISFITKPDFSRESPDFSREFLDKNPVWFPSGNFSGRSGPHWNLRQGALESSRFCRCTHGRRAMAGLKLMSWHSARQCHGTGESSTLSFKFKLRVITLK